jgi:hypothetical protein
VVVDFEGKLDFSIQMIWRIRIIIVTNSTRSKASQRINMSSVIPGKAPAGNVSERRVQRTDIVFFRMTTSAVKRTRKSGGG